MDTLKTFPLKALTFLKEVKIEVEKVKWPTRDDAIRLTTIVILFSAVVALFLGGWDWLFRVLLEKILGGKPA